MNKGLKTALTGLAFTYIFIVKPLSDPDGWKLPVFVVSGVFFVFAFEIFGIRLGWYKLGGAEPLSFKNWRHLVGLLWIFIAVSFAAVVVGYIKL